MNRKPPGWVSTPNNMSASSIHAFNTSDFVAGAARASSGTKDADYIRRITKGHGTPSVDDFEKIVLDYYMKMCLAPSSKHSKVRGFKECADHFEDLFKSRCAYNIEQAIKGQAEGHSLVMAVLPAAFMCRKLPTEAQKQHWQNRWNDDGDLLKFFMSQAPGGMVLPFIHHSITTYMPVQLAVVMVIPPHDLD